MLINTVTPKEFGINPYDLLTDVIVYYPMKGNLNDIGPNGFNLTHVGSYTIGTNWIETSSSFNATNTSATYPTNSSVTTAIWVNGGAGGLYLGSDNYSGWGMATELQSSWNGVNVVVSGNSFGATQNTSLSGWNMITGVFDYSAHTVTYYQNGNLITSTSTNSGGLRGGSFIAYGLRSSKMGIGFATANAMTQADIQAFYNASKNLYI